MRPVQPNRLGVCGAAKGKEANSSRAFLIDLRMLGVRILSYALVGSPDYYSLDYHTSSIQLLGHRNA
jgi:hypothetical protein